MQVPLRQQNWTATTWHILKSLWPGLFVSSIFYFFVLKEHDLYLHTTWILRVTYSHLAKGCKRVASLSNENAAILAVMNNNRIVFLQLLITVVRSKNVLATHIEVCLTIGSERFSWFSEWSKLQGAITKLITVVRSKSETLTQDNVTATKVYHKPKVVIMISVQRQAFGKEIECIKRSGKVSRSTKVVF